MGVLGNVLGNLGEFTLKLSKTVSERPKTGELDFHPLRSKYFRARSSFSVIDCPAPSYAEPQERSFAIERCHADCLVRMGREPLTGVGK